MKMTAQYRSVLGITHEILEACTEAGLDGIMISEISLRANLSYRQVTANCERLTDAAMLRDVRNGRTHVYIITEKGILFFREFQRFQDTVKELNIRY